MAPTRRGVLGLIGTLAMAAGVAGPAAAGTDPLPDRAATTLSAAPLGALDSSYIVMLETGAAGTTLDVPSGKVAAQAEAQVRRATEDEVEQARGRGIKVNDVYETLGGYSATLTTAQVAQLRRDPAVALVEKDAVVTASVDQSGATWGLDRSDQRSRTLNGIYGYTRTGSGVTSYVIDTGINGAHSEFTGRMGAGATAISDGRGTGDCNGHGTHVAGTVGGTRYGVAKGTRLVPVRVLGCDGSGTTTGVIAGMDWVADTASGPSVANMSLGGPASSAQDAAVNRMVSSGVTVVVAAGNENQNACNVSPARAAAAITVGATTKSDYRSSFSNYGSCVDVFAPGSAITSAWYTSSTATNTISGTSMASPHVAGAAALYLQGNPSASPSQVTSALVGTATTNVVRSAGSGSPNRLLYTRGVN